MLSAGGGYEAAVIARINKWFKFMECGKLLSGKRFHLRLNLNVYKSYGSEAWHLKESELIILRWIERSMV